ncbi:MAG: hypothetical protein NTNFB02_03010 [Nitrospira sp.]
MPEEKGKVSGTVSLPTQDDKGVTAHHLSRHTRWETLSSASPETVFDTHWLRS